ncbi:hypothetical protein [Proteus phage VTCCBPA139]|nr:hypothetical protein [Proteus phage VTCCBPA139]
MTLVDIVLTYSNGRQWHAKNIVLESIHAVNEYGRPLLIYHSALKELSTETEDIHEFSKSENSFVTNNLTLFSSTGVELDILADGLINLEITAHESLWGKELSNFENVLSKLVIDLSDSDKFDIVEFTALGTKYSAGDMVNIYIVPLDK